MTAISVTPYDLYAAGQVFAGAQDRLQAITQTLGSALGGCGGMAGDDQAGHQFAGGYDPAAASLISTLCATVPVIGQMAGGLVATANNFLRAEGHSTAGASVEPFQYPLPGLTMAVTMTSPPSTIGAGSGSGLPGPIGPMVDRFWASGHADRLRAAKDALWKTAGDLTNLGYDLQAAVRSVTDNNSAPSIEAMDRFFAQVWTEAIDSTAPLPACIRACNKLSSLCDQYANAIDQQHHQAISALENTGVSLAAITVTGALLSELTFGGSDALAGSLDAATITSTLQPILTAFLDSLSYLAPDARAVLAALNTAEAAVPSLTVVVADTTQVSGVLDTEMAVAVAADDSASVIADETSGDYSLGDLERVEQHLSSRGLNEVTNDAMIARVQQAIQDGRPLTEGERNFMKHELTEAQLMDEGMPYEEAHQLALQTHPLFKNYDPQVIDQYAQYFNNAWRKAWGLPPR